MKLQEFNEMTIYEAKQVLEPCVHIESWMNTIIDHRPYTHTDKLYQLASEQAKHWQWNEIQKTLARHPRIGEKTAVKVLSDKENAFSEREQSTMHADDALNQAILQGNLDYEHKFGHIFLIRAAGRSAQNILSELRRRLNNTDEVEQQEVKQQLAEIALLRLKQEIV